MVEWLEKLDHNALAIIIILLLVAVQLLVRVLWAFLQPVLPGQAAKPVSCMFDQECQSVIKAKTPDGAYLIHFQREAVMREHEKQDDKLLSIARCQERIAEKVAESSSTQKAIAECLRDIRRDVERGGCPFQGENA